MDEQHINEKLALGEINTPGVFPHVDRLKTMRYIFKMDFGLDALPTEPGILMIRGARQYGKSTWLEQQLQETIQVFGAGSAYYLNGDNLLSEQRLAERIQALVALYAPNAPVRRLFIDEITSIAQWEIVLKRLVDNGALSNVLVVTTGSKATDLRRGGERLPGRKGRLNRSTYLFTPVSYSEFKKICGHTLGEQTFLSYLLSGGSPIACAELATQGRIPEFVIELVRDWVDGEITATGRSRAALLNIMQSISRFGGTPIGQAKLARESGLSNNTVAQGYIEILNDLGCIIPAYPWDSDRQLPILRKPCKYHCTNLLVALAYHPARIRCIADFLALEKTTQGLWYEWLVAQELLRRNAIEGSNILAPLTFWQNKHHEIDFVANPHHFIEVKRGNSSPMAFGWFAHQFPHQKLTVINQKSFSTEQITGISLEHFLDPDTPPNASAETR